MEADVAANQSSLDDKTAQYSAMEGKYKAANYESQLGALKKEKETLRQSRKEHSDTAAQLQQESSRRSELKLKRADLDKKEQQMEEL